MPSLLWWCWRWPGPLAALAALLRTSSVTLAVPVGTQHCTRPSPHRNPVNYEQTRCIWWPWWCWVWHQGGHWMWLGEASQQGERWLVAAMVEVGWDQQWREPTAPPPPWLAANLAGLLVQPGCLLPTASWQPPGPWQKSEISEVSTALHGDPGADVPQEWTEFFSMCTDLNYGMKQFFWYSLKEKNPVSCCV